MLETTAVRPRQAARPTTADGVALPGDKQHQLRLDGNFESLEPVRALCTAALAEFCPDEDAREDIQSRLSIAANEAAANVIEHGLRYDPSPTFTVQASCRRSRLQIQFSYEGDQVQTTQAPRIESPQEGGMGLYLIEQCVDHVTYETTTDGKQLTCLSFNLPTTEQHP